MEDGWKEKVEGAELNAGKFDVRAANDGTQLGWWMWRRKIPWQSLAQVGFMEVGSTWVGLDDFR